MKPDRLEEVQLARVDEEGPGDRDPDPLGNLHVPPVPQRQVQDTLAENVGTFRIG